MKAKTLRAMGSKYEVHFQDRIVLPNGGGYIDRTILTKLPSGAVRQVIGSPTDNGEGWTTGFDAAYRARQ